MKGFEDIHLSDSNTKNEYVNKFLNGNYNEAKAKAIEYNEIFGAGNYYLEVQNHGIEEQVKILPLIYRILPKDLAGEVFSYIVSFYRFMLSLHA